MGQTIEKMWAFVAINQEGNEDIIGGMENQFWFPFICSNIEALEHIKPLVRKYAEDNKLQVKLIELSHRRDLEAF